MTRIIDEQLSALLDGELPGEQESMLLRRLDSEPACRETLARYGLIGELLRSGAAETSALSISDRVSAAIAAEAAPRAVSVSSSSPSSAGTGFVGAGIAASIALLVVVNLADIEASRVPALSSGVEPLLVAQADPLPVDEVRLTRYLVAHAQFSNSASRQLVNSHVAMSSTGSADWANHD